MHILPLGALLAVASSVALAEEPPAPAPAAVFVISGGASQGAYQAGQLYVFTEHLKRVRRNRAACADPQVESALCDYVRAFPEDLAFVGASAGSINAILSTVSLLTEAELVDRPEYSLHFRAWVPMGVRRDDRSLDIFPAGGDEGQLSLFSRASLQAALAELAARPVLPEADRWPGALSLGIATNRLIPEVGPLRDRAVNISFGFRVPEDLVAGMPLDQQGFDALVLTPSLRLPTEPGAPVVLGDTAKTAGPLGWTLSTLGDASTRTPVVTHPLTSRRDGYAPGVFDLFRSSSGIPFVFEIEALDRCWVEEHALFNPERSADVAGRGGLGGDHCEAQPPVLMADGGVFDGNPMRAGQVLSLVGALGTGDDAVRLLDQELEAIDGEGWQKPTYYFLDPDLGMGREHDAAARSSDEFVRLMGFVGGVASAARLQELTAFTLENPDADIRVVAPASGRDETFSGYAGAFLGFFDRSLRAWDFYVGMHDAMSFLASGAATPARYVRDGETTVRLAPYAPVPAELLPAVRGGAIAGDPAQSTLFEIVERLLAADVLESDCPPGSERPFCQDLERIRVSTGDDRVLAVTLDTRLDADLGAPAAGLLACPEDGSRPAACVAYDPAAMAANLRRLGWISVERRADLAEAEHAYELDWITNKLSDRLFANAPSTWLHPRALFTGWDLGEAYAPRRTPAEQCIDARLRGHEREETKACAREDLDLGPAQGRISPTTVPDFAALARKRLSWELAAFHWRRGRPAILGQPSNPNLPYRTLAWYAREQLTGNGALYYAGYLSPGGRGGSDGAVLGYLHYLDSTFRPYRALYGGLELGVQLPRVPEGALVPSARVGLAPLRGLRQPSMLANDHPVFGVELGGFASLYPLAPWAEQRAEAAFIPYLRPVGTVGSAGPMYWAWGPELRFNLVGLLSATVSVPVSAGMQLQDLYDNNRFTAVFTLPIANVGRQPPRWGP